MWIALLALLVVPVALVDGRAAAPPQVSVETALRAEGLVPGSRRAGAVTISNDGGSPVRLRLAMAAADAGGGELASHLKLSLQDRDLELEPGRSRTLRAALELSRDAPDHVQGDEVRLELRWRADAAR